MLQKYTVDSTFPNRNWFDIDYNTIVNYINTFEAVTLYEPIKTQRLHLSSLL